MLNCFLINLNIYMNNFKSKVGIYSSCIVNSFKTGAWFSMIKFILNKF